MEGRRCCCVLFKEPGLLQSLHQHSHGQYGRNFCMFGDSNYPIQPNLMGTFRVVQMTDEHRKLNCAMSKLRQSIEWIISLTIFHWKCLKIS